jgi:site-specific recombinase XerD
LFFEISSVIAEKCHLVDSNIWVTTKVTTMKNSVTTLPLNQTLQPQTMTNTIRVLFWFRKNQSKDSDKGVIYCRVTLSGKRIEICSTEQYCNVKDWNADNQKFKTSLSSHLQANIILANIEKDILNIYLSYENQKKKLSCDLLKAILKGKIKQNPCFNEVLKVFLTERRQLSLSSKVSYRNKCKIFQTFCKSIHLPNIEVFEITPRLMNRFFAYCIEEGYSETYGGKAKQVIKTVLSWAYELEKITENPLGDYIVKLDRKVNTEHLTVEELQTIIDYQFDESLQQVTDCFVFCCLTGLEYSGIHALNIRKNIIIVDGRMCLEAERLKTGVQRFVPLSPLAIQLVEKYRKKNIFPVHCNQFMNKCLKIIALHVGIKKRLFWHLARKTFADHCLNENGMSVEATVTAMGQSNLDSIKPYARLDRRRVLKEFK